MNSDSCFYVATTHVEQTGPISVISVSACLDKLKRESVRGLLVQLLTGSINTSINSTTMDFSPHFSFFYFTVICWTYLNLKKSSKFKSTGILVSIYGTSTMTFKGILSSFYRNVCVFFEYWQLWLNYSNWFRFRLITMPCTFVQVALTSAWIQKLQFSWT